MISSYNKQFKQYSPNYYLHHAIIEYYKNDYDFIDLNGITGDFSKDNPYKGLNEFKQGFNPLSFEYIGEYDFIINPGLYKSMEENGILAKEFNKKQKNITQ
jgi:lipid II:glycine glycyltransferase (peptidoglycan interpeptide bridge formation enzyme)